VAGDFTGDGRIDLAVVNQVSQDVSVLLGNGDGTFQPRVTYAVGNAPDAIATGDFNGDGRVDLAVANRGPHDVSILLGNGDGTFQPQVTYTVGSQPGAIVTGDFNGDGRTDLAVASGGDVSVLLGNGDGTFQPAVTYAVGSGAGTLVAGNFTANGRTDLAFANSNANKVSVLPGNGDGTFGFPETYTVGPDPVALVAGEFTGDGRTDLATVNSGSGDVSLLLNLNGTLVAPGSVATNFQATPVVVDLPGDGVDDVFVVNAAGDILWRKGHPQNPGTFDPLVTINPGHPSRDIAAVDTNLGPVLASVDATDNAVSLYAWRNGSFGLIGSLATGSLPAQVVAGDLTGDGLSDLVVRNAGDGTLSIYLNAGFASGSNSSLPAPFLPAIVVPVGLGVSDVTLADASGGGSTDIVVANKLTGEVGVVHNLSPGVYDPVVLYRASSGLYGVTDSANDNNLSATLTTLEATAGVAAGAFTAGGPPSLVAINPGSNTFSVLSGLGGGRFANPMTLPRASPAIAVRVADLEGNGIPDAILLSTNGVTVYRGDGKGGFLPDPFTISAGPDATGMSVGDNNHDGKPDLLVSNAFGDLLVLLGNGDGTFQPYHRADQQVALAVLPNGSAAPDFVYADQGLDEVVVDYAGGQTKTVADRSSGLLAPGAVQLADLNGDGIPDLIVANSGSNDVLVYPGLGNGQFGPELNGGHGFFTGTDPVGITVANLNGRPDLVIANEGSNDVSILLNVPTADGGFTFVAGPRLQGGPGPTSTVVENVPGDPFPDLLVSDSGANQVPLLRGVGGGFFNDQDPTIFDVGNEPTQVMVGTFTANAGQGPQIATINRGSNDVTLISSFNSPAPVIQSFPTGGIDPVAAFGVDATGSGLESLLVANAGDGLFTLLGGSDGLEVEATLSNPELPEPSALALAAVNRDEIEFYATTAGVEAAFALAFILPTSGAASSPIPGASATEGPAVLVPLTETSLPLAGTLLTIALKPESPTTSNSQGLAASQSQSVSQTELNVALLPGASPSSSQGLATAAGETTFAVSSSSSGASSAPSVGQSLIGSNNKPEESREGENEPHVNPAPQYSSIWSRFLPDVDEIFDQIREENRARERGGAEPDADATDECRADTAGFTTVGWALPTSSSEDRWAVPTLRGLSLPTQAVDEAIEKLYVEQPVQAPPIPPAFHAQVAVGMPLVLAGITVIHVSPLVDALRDRRMGKKE
jgi:hypothetical protein